jgi:hypothetical protein
VVRAHYWATACRVILLVFPVRLPAKTSRPALVFSRPFHVQSLCEDLGNMLFVPRWKNWALLSPSAAALTGTVHLAEVVMFAVRLFSEAPDGTSIARRCVHMVAQQIEKGLTLSARLPSSAAHEPSATTLRTTSQKLVRTMHVYRMFMATKSRGIITSTQGNLAGIHTDQDVETGAGSGSYDILLESRGSFRAYAGTR